MQNVKCSECGVVIGAPAGNVLVRHNQDGTHDTIRFDPGVAQGVRTGLETIVDAGPAASVAGALERALPSFHEVLDAVSLVRANVLGRLDQLEVQVSGIIVRDLSALMLRVSELELAMGKFDGPLLFDLRARVESLERLAGGAEGLAFRTIEHRLANVEHLLNARGPLES